ncbi:MAG: alpha/beta hydrolase [Burkholderiales bacterium]|jgi:pimeloyl-ACP methyl ester carboxylesterase|nr:alpha/beta hydrolase [Burkholderiales bacterium]
MTTLDHQLSRRAWMATAGALSVSTLAVSGGSHAAELPVAKLFYTELGSGQNVMLLHGWTCDSHDWSWQLPAFESKYRVVNVDLRGHGRSDAPATGYTPKEFAADVESLISTKYPGQQFVLVGHSMGGQVAAILGAKRPDLIKAIVSVDGTLGVPSAAQATYEKLDASIKAGNPGDVIPPVFSGLYSAESDRAVIRWHTRRIQGMQAHVLRQSLATLFLGPDQVAMGPKSEALCRSLKMPVYAMHRSQARVDTVAPWFTAQKSKSELWQGPGHWIMLDRKEAFNAAVMGWIDAL